MRMSIFRITIACCVLHNIALDRNMPLHEFLDDLQGPMDENEESNRDSRHDHTMVSETILRRKGNEKRKRIAEFTFSRRH